LTPAVFTPGLGGGGVFWAEIMGVSNPATAIPSAIFSIVVVHNNRSCPLARL